MEGCSYAHIYSLGVTLYELLSLRPVFEGDRQEVLRQIAFDEPRPLRRLKANVPKELETIVLKAMAKDPGSRYATALELAEDLRRFLDHKPIKARRPSPLERVAPKRTGYEVSELAWGAKILGRPRA